MCVRVYLRWVRCSLALPDFQSVPSSDAHCESSTPSSPNSPTSSHSPSPSLSVAFSDTFPLSSVPLRGPVTQQSLNHRFEVSLLCLETYGIGRKGKSNTDPGSMGEYIPSCGFECCIALPGSPPVVGPTSLYARVLVIALCGIKCLIRG